MTVSLWLTAYVRICYINHLKIIFNFLKTITQLSCSEYQLLCCMKQLNPWIFYRLRASIRKINACECCVILPVHSTASLTWLLVPSEELKILGLFTRQCLVTQKAHVSLSRGTTAQLIMGFSKSVGFFFSVVKACISEVRVVTSVFHMIQESRNVLYDFE